MRYRLMRKQKSTSVEGRRIEPITCPHCGGRSYLMRRTLHPNIKGEIWTFECKDCNKQTEMSKLILKRTCEPFERTFSEARLSCRNTSTRYLKVTQRQIDDSRHVDVADQGPRTAVFDHRLVTSVKNRDRMRGGSSLLASMMLANCSSLLAHSPRSSATSLPSAKIQLCLLWSNSGQTRVRSDCPLSANRGLAWHFTKDVAPSRQTPPRLSPQPQDSRVPWRFPKFRATVLIVLDCHER